MLWIICTIFFILYCLSIPKDAFSGRKIPDDNLGYPIFISLPTGNTGSGFYINTDNATYLITARHVLFDEKKLGKFPDNAALISDNAILLSYPKDPKDNGRVVLYLDLKYLLKTKRIHYHPTNDIVVAKIGEVSNDNTNIIRFLDGVNVKSFPKSGMVGVGRKAIKFYKDVLVSNEIIIFGFPTSIGLKQIPQIDYNKPLLRMGIVAGTNDITHTIIVDCSVYHGNSGGPVLEIEEDGFKRYFNAIGVVTQFIPVAEYWKNITNDYVNITLTNSGYAVVQPMDSVIELINGF